MSSIVFSSSSSLNKQSSVLANSFINPKTLTKPRSLAMCNSAVVGNCSSRDVIVIARSSVNNGVSPIVVNNLHFKASDNPIVVIDNYDSFTYNLCQVCILLTLHCFFVFFSIEKFRFLCLIG